MADRRGSGEVGHPAAGTAREPMTRFYQSAAGIAN